MRGNTKAQVQQLQQRCVGRRASIDGSPIGNALAVCEHAGLLAVAAGLAVDVFSVADACPDLLDARRSCRLPLRCRTALLQPYTSPACALAWSPPVCATLALLIGDEAGNVMLADPAAGRVMRTLVNGAGQPVTGLAWLHRDRILLARHSPGWTLVCGTYPDSPMRVAVDTCDEPVRVLLPLAVDRVATATSQGTLTVWAINDGEDETISVSARLAATPGQAIVAVAAMQGGGFLLSRADGGISIVSPDAQRVVASYQVALAPGKPVVADHALQRSRLLLLLDTIKSPVLALPPAVDGVDALPSLKTLLSLASADVALESRPLALHVFRSAVSSRVIAWANAAILTETHVVLVQLPSWAVSRPRMDDGDDVPATSDCIPEQANKNDGDDTAAAAAVVADHPKRLDRDALSSSVRASATAVPSASASSLPAHLSSSSQPPHPLPLLSNSVAVPSADAFLHAPSPELLATLSTGERVQRLEQRVLALAEHVEKLDLAVTQVGNASARSLSHVLRGIHTLGRDLEKLRRPASAPDGA